MTAIITALAKASRGHPVTDNRHYLLLPVCGKPLLQWQMERLGTNEVTLLLNDHEKEFEDIPFGIVHFHSAKDTSAVKELLSKADVILPGDLLPVQGAKGIITFPESSEESDALEAFIGLKGTAAPHRINYPWELLDVGQALAEKLEPNVDATADIEEGVTIKGAIIVGKNTNILAGSYLEGPLTIGENCTIGPQAHIRPNTFIGNGCTIGKTEVVGSVIMDGSVSKHHAYIGYSVIGENVNVGAFSVTTDYRHDGKDHTTLVNGKKVETKRRKLGAFIGDNVRLGVHTIFYPGRKLSPGGSTLPGEIVKEDR